MNGRVVVRALAGCLCLALCAAPAAAQASAAALQKALDRPVNLVLSDANVPEVFRQLTEQTGARFDLEPLTLEVLPYGEQTRLSIKVRNVTLRNALTPMLAPQGLQWSIASEAVRVSPAEPLARMGRRATYDELRVLGKLFTGMLQPPDKGGDIIEQLQRMTETPSLRLRMPLGAEGVEETREKANALLPATPAAWLDGLCSLRNWTWYLWGDEVILLPLRDQIERQLRRRISLSYQNAKLTDVLLDLAARGRFHLEMAPGVLTKLSDDIRERFNLVIAEASISEAMEVITGATGLVFHVTDQGVRVEPSPELAASTTRESRPRSPFFLRMTLPVPGEDGLAAEVYLRADDLPPELVKKILAERDKLILRLAPDAVLDPNSADLH